MIRPRQAITNGTKRWRSAWATWFSFVLACCGLLIASGCRTMPTGRDAERDLGYDSTPRVAIMSAFEPEIVKLRREAQVKTVRVINGRSYYVGELAGQQVVLVLTGISMVNASRTTQELLDHFAVRQLVFSGIAGGINPGLHIGDVTVPAEWGQYQEQVFAREVSGGWDTNAFEVEFPNYGMMFPGSVKVTRRGGTPDQTEKRFWFPADSACLELARRLTNGIGLSLSSPEGETGRGEMRVVVGGRGVSGPTFVDDAAYRQWVWTTFHADVLDMESAAVATVAYVNRVPFIAFRALSDLAGGGKGVNEMRAFLQSAADNSAMAVLAYLRALSGSEPKPKR